MPKQRKVFAMRNFLGLDKENKPLKVAPFRASDGYNFQIDSETLKTREGFVIDSFIETDLPSGASVIDWYEYKNVIFYVATNSFYVVSSTTTDLKTGNNVTRSSIGALNNTGKKPIFREEKNALFIFGLDAVFVFAILNDASGDFERYVIYDIANKPTNPYNVGDFNYDTYEELPLPYEPTLFIGDTPFEDVNLLSKVSKYELFANKETIDGYVKYFLPTHYDPDKNGSFTTDFKFYESTYQDLEIFPIFLGIDGENFEYDSATYGQVYNAENIDVEDVFYPSTDFEYFKDYTLDPPVVGDVITNIVGLTKDKFFTLRVQDQSKNVFEYLLGEIKQQQSTITTNKVVKFELPIEYNVIYRPDGDYATINERKVERDTVIVYVHLKKFDSQTIFASDSFDEISLSTQTNVLETDLTYPAYPTIAEPVDYTVTLPAPIPVNSTNFQSLVAQEFDSYMDSNKFNYVDEDKVKIQGQFYYPFTQSYQRFVNINSPIVNSNVAQFSYPAYPSFSNPNGDEVVTINTFNFNTFYPVSTSALENALDNYLTNNVNTIFSNNNGNAYVQYQFYAYDSNNGLTFYYSNVAYVEYQKDFTEDRHIRVSASTWVEITVDQTPSKQTLTRFNFNEQKNWFELEVKDYFYDYNQQPSINVKVTFTNNPNYELITKNKFGIFFGSEDRLFLAGHPDYPNIDRYNVSNDLLGDNIVNQSYELSYFPSKNYRVVGGKGAINGYVIATDTQLYVTKKEYPNDSKLFIRERSLDNNGLAGYKEFKTSVLETPLNERCIVRFYNDILMLTKNGLYGIEISSNVLTNERLLKLRSGYINKDLKVKIANESVDNIYIVENNQMMYIFVGKDVYVADSRYISKNENSEIENLSYELINWKMQEYYDISKFKNNVLYAIARNSEVKLKLIETDEDYIADYLAASIYNGDFSLTGTSYDTNFLTINDNTKATSTYTNFSKSSIYLPTNAIATQVFAKVTTDYAYVSFANNLATFSIPGNSIKLLRLQDGDTIYFIDGSNVRHEYTIGTVTSTNFTVVSQSSTFFETNSNISMMGFDASKKELYPIVAFIDNGNYYFRYSLDKPVSSFTYDNATQNAALVAKLEEVNDYLEIIVHNNSAVGGIISQREPIVFLWQSAMTDFGNNLMEKTIYRSNVYATKKATSSDLYFGYKTMRRFKSLTDTNIVPFDLNVDISNLSSLEDLDFTSFAINTFEEFGMSLPMKENNFLYIQFIIKGEGRLELNALELIYKDNRRLKSIG